MKATYTITRYGNGWAVDTDTGDAIKNYSAVFEDFETSSNIEEDGARLDSLISLLVNTFEELDDVDFYVPVIEEDDDESEEIKEKEKEDDSTG